MPGGVDAELVRDVTPRRPGDRHDPRKPPGDASLHPDEPVPAFQRQAPLPPIGVGELELPVDGDGMVNRRQHRPAVGHHAEEARTERLVVVDEIELAETPCQETPGAQGEGERFRKARAAHDGELEDVDRRLELGQRRHPKRVRLPVQVQARDPYKLHAGVELGIRLP